MRSRSRGTFLSTFFILTWIPGSLSAQSFEDLKEPEGSRSRVSIYWADNGVPHIEARDWYSLGYGSAYAAAAQNFCILADQLLKIKSQRSLYFGAGEKNENIISDIGNLALGYVDDSKNLFSKLTPRAQQLIEGYAAGYNRYLSERSPEQYPRPCRDATWIQPTTQHENPPLP